MKLCQHLIASGEERVPLGDVPSNQHLGVFPLLGSDLLDVLLLDFTQPLGRVVLRLQVVYQRVVIGTQQHQVVEIVYVLFGQAGVMSGRAGTGPADVADYAEHGPAIGVDQRLLAAREGTPIAREQAELLLG